MKLKCDCKVYQVKYYTYYYYPDNQKTNRPVYFNSWISPDETIPYDEFLDKGLMAKPVNTLYQTLEPHFVWYLKKNNIVREYISISEGVSTS